MAGLLLKILTGPIIPKKVGERKSDYLFLSWIIALSFLIRLIHLVDIKDNPFFNVLLADGSFHDKWARSILNGDWLSLKQGVFYKAPLYPYFLALVYRIFGDDLFIVKVVHVIIALSGYVILYRLAGLYFNKTVARISLILAMVYGPFIYFEGEIEIVVLVFSLNLLMLFFIARNSLHSNRLHWFLAGITLGLSALARPTILIFIPFVLTWLFFTYGEGGERKKIIDSMTFFFLGIILLVAPVTIRNYMLGDRFVLISSNGGINFYIGNNPDYEETTSIQPGIAWERLTMEPGKALGKRLKTEEAEGHWYSKTKDFILSEPLSFMTLFLKKSALFWHSYEIKRNKDLYFFKRYSRVLQSPLITFGILAPLSILGITLTLSRWKNYLLLYLYTAYVMLSTAAFFVTARYRIPAVPVLMIFAAYSLHWFYQKIREKETKKIGAFLFLFIILLLLTNFDFFDVKERTFARSHYNLGLVYSQTEQYDRAIEEFKEALELNPPQRLENSETHLNLALLYNKKEEYNKAVEEGQKAVSILPDYARAHRVLSESYYRTKRYRLAEEELNLSLKYEPDNAEAYFRLGNIYAKTEKNETAAANYKKAISLKPDYPEAHNNLGLLSYQKGRLLEAIKGFQEAIKAKPELAEAHFNLGVVYDDMGLFDKAMKAYTKAIELDTGYYKAYNNLGIIYGRKNLYDKAGYHFQKALEIKADDEETKNNLVILKKKMKAR